MGVWGPAPRKIIIVLERILDTFTDTEAVPYNS